MDRIEDEWAEVDRTEVDRIGRVRARDCCWTDDGEVRSARERIAEDVERRARRH